MTAQQQEARTNTWSELEAEARDMRASADRLVALVEGVRNGADTALSAELERIRTRVLEGVAGEAVTSLPATPIRRTSTTQARGRTKFMCEICKADGHRYVAKNSRGLAIHMGRQHEKKADRLARQGKEQAAPVAIDGEVESGGESASTE